MISERISDDIPPQMKSLNWVIPILMNFHFSYKFKRCKPNKAAHHPTKCDEINDVKLFPTVSQDIAYCPKFLMLSNQTSRYKASAIH